MKSIKIDGAFPEYGAKQLAEALSNGWHVYDSWTFGDRYKTYLLHYDPDVGKSGEPTPPQIKEL